jgi:uncharacterized membrane protein YhhN
MMPFPGGIEANANALLVFSLAAAMSHVFALSMPPKLLRSVVKPLATGLLAVLALTEGGPLLLAAALALSAIGDALLSRGGANALLSGLASLVAAFVLYAIVFSVSGAGIGLPLADPWRIAVGLVMVVGALATLVSMRQRAVPRVYPLLVAGSAVVLGMGLCALSVDSPWIVLGAVLLMISGGLFVLEKLHAAPQRTEMRAAVWIASYAGQLAITLGFLLG